MEQRRILEEALSEALVLAGIIDLLSTAETRQVGARTNRSTPELPMHVSDLAPTVLVPCFAQSIVHGLCFSAGARGQTSSVE